MTHDFASNRHLVGLLHLLIVGTSLLSLMAYFLDYTLLFRICAPLCTLLTLAVSFAVAHYTPEGIGFVTYFNAALFLAVGMAIDRSVFPGLLVGGAVYGLAYMVPVAVTDMMIDYHHRKIASIRRELSETKEELLESLSKEESLSDRVSYMQDIYNRHCKTVPVLLAGIESLVEGTEDIDELRDYYDSGRWDRDRLALTAEGELPEFFSEDGLPRFFDELDGFLETLSEIAAEAQKR